MHEQNWRVERNEWFSDHTTAQLFSRVFFSLSVLNLLKSDTFVRVMHNCRFLNPIKATNAFQDLDANCFMKYFNSPFCCFVN